MQADQFISRPHLSLQEYQERACRANQFAGQEHALDHLRFGLFGEIGGVLAAVKKGRRDLAPAQHMTLAEELGDALWYLATACMECGTSLQDVGVDAIAELERQLEVKGPVQTAQLSFEMIDGLLSFRCASIESMDLTATLNRLGSRAGNLLTVSAKPDLTNVDAKRLLAELLADMAITAAVLKHRIATVAEGNLKKVESRWEPPSAEYTERFDKHMPALERFPDQLEMHFIEVPKANGVCYVIQQMNGVNIGDRLTDNRTEPDGYRFHDVFHLAYLVFLGWSPVIRGLLKLKRKSDPSLDENQDGARAMIIEEGIATWIFNQSSAHGYFETTVKGKLDYGMLKQVQDMVAGYEVAACPLWQWEKAILEGFSIFRQLYKSRGGIVTANLEARTLTFSERKPSIETPAPEPERPALVGIATPPEFL